MEAREARQSNWLGRSTVRSLRPGTAFDLIGLPIDPTKAVFYNCYVDNVIIHLGINNLSGEAIAAIAQRLGRAPLKIDAAHTPWLPGARLPITDFFVNYKLSSSRSAALMQLFDFQNRIICIM